MPVKIFFCYAHEDEELLNKLKSHLRPLQRQGLIDVWHDRDISAGTEWEQEISKHLNEAQIILLLVSPDFMNSDYCYGTEMKRAIERHEQGEARVIPIILRPVYWQEVLEKLQALPTDGKPVLDRKWHNQDEAFLDIVEGIRKVVRILLTERQEAEKEQIRRSEKERIRKAKKIETQLAGKETPSVHSPSTQPLAAGSTSYSEMPIQKQPTLDREVNAQLIDSSASNKKITCPFCLYECSVTDLCFRCKNPTCSGRVLDEVFAKALQEVPKVMGKVLTPSKPVFGFPKVLECETCKEESQTRICPACHFELPHDIGQVDQCTLSIVAGSNTGKTHYIATLITRLKYWVGGEFNFTVRMIGEDTQTRWEEDYYKPLFEGKTLLRPTPLAEVDPTVKNPLVFRLTFTSGKRRRAVNVSLYDLAGEDMVSLGRGSLQARYICRSHGIILLLDPLQINAIRQDLGVAGPSINRKASPDYLVGWLRDLFEWQNNLSADEQIKTPTAFTLSKVDTLLPIVNPEVTLLRPSRQFGQLDLNDLQSMSTEIENYLWAWVSQNFCSIVRDNFAHYQYFGISSLGGQPDSNSRLVNIRPLRVEDPFLWILYQLGLIERRKRFFR